MPDVTGLMVGLWIPADAAARLAVEGGEPASTLHLTLAFLGKLEDLDDVDDATARSIAAVVDVAEAFGPVSGRISGVGRFQTPEQDVVYASFDSPGLPELRHRLVRELKRQGVPPLENHGFTPHITLAYVEPGAPSPVGRLPELELTFSELTVAAGDRRLGVRLEDRMGDETQTTVIKARIAKVDQPKGLVFGWAKLSMTEDGKILVDHHRDIVSPEQLEETAYDFVLHSRDGGEMHVRGGTSRLVESMVFTDEKLAEMARGDEGNVDQEKLAILKSIIPVGWWLGYKIDDPDVLAKAASGYYADFSIEGTSHRIPIEVPADLAKEAT